MHSMYFDTSYNSLDTTLANLYRLFHDAAQRAEGYIRSMPKHGAPSFETIKGMLLLSNIPHCVVTCFLGHHVPNNLWHQLSEHVSPQNTSSMMFQNTQHTKALIKASTILREQIPSITYSMRKKHDGFRCDQWSFVERSSLSRSSAL